MSFTHPNKISHENLVLVFLFPKKHNLLGSPGYNNHLLATALSVSCGIQVINLSDNYLTPPGIVYLTDLILKNQFVRELYLFRCNRLSATDQELLSEAQNALKLQCNGERLHAMLLWSV